MQHFGAERFHEAKAFSVVVDTLKQRVDHKGGSDLGHWKYSSFWLHAGKTEIRKAYKINCSGLEGRQITRSNNRNLWRAQQKVWLQHML